MFETCLLGVWTAVVRDLLWQRCRQATASGALSILLYDMIVCIRNRGHDNDIAMTMQFRVIRRRQDGVQAGAGQQHMGGDGDCHARLERRGQGRSRLPQGLEARLRTNHEPVHSP